MNMKEITFNGETLCITEWARRLGLNRVTLQARITRYGMPLEKALSSASLALKSSGGWYKVARNTGPRRYEHQRVAEKALGKPLPPKAEVHHVDENKRNNDPSNLVICPDHAYHSFLHQRAAAFDAFGDASARKCVYCGQWDSVSNLRINKQNSARHLKCHAKYHAALRQRKTEE